MDDPKFRQALQYVFNKSFIESMKVELNNEKYSFYQDTKILQFTILELLKEMFPKISQLTKDSKNFASKFRIQFKRALKDPKTGFNMEKQQRLIRKAINFDNVLAQILRDIDSNNIDNNDKEILF